jgi:hypothetical protein
LFNLVLSSSEQISPVNATSLQLVLNSNRNPNANANPNPNLNPHINLNVDLRNKYRLIQAWFNASTITYRF